MNRRLFLQGCGVGMVVPAAHASRASTAKHVQIKAEPGLTSIVGPDFPATKVWGYDGQVPGTVIRVKQGQALTARIVNSLDVPTAVHWHGIRLPNSMDGVAGLTQPAIQPGETFEYNFTPPDAGTYWYHSHVNAHEQIGRGLYGPLIIEEPEPPVIDRELIWMIDDWRLGEDASIIDNFGAGHDMSHAGRIGNVPTVNGRFRDVIKVRTGERLRLRLINASNARNFSLSFGELKPTIIAIDGQPVKPFTSAEPITIGAAGRVDIILDMTGDPESISVVTDQFYRESYDLIKFAYQKQPLRESTLNESMQLTPNPLTEPDLPNSKSLTVTLAGGAMGGLREAQLNGQWMDLREIARQGYVWAINNIVGNKLDMPPLISVQTGQTIRLTIDNQTAFPHPMHLHGHHMKLLSVDDQVPKEPRWVDSPLLMPRQRMEFAFVADNPGNWLFHCHVLEHHAAGLGSLVSVG